MAVEISLIYRFSYHIHESEQASRAPITMKLVFPASKAKLELQS